MSWPLNITKDLVCLRLKHVTDSSQSHWDSIVPEFIKFINDSCKVVTFIRKIYGETSNFKV